MSTYAETLAELFPRTTEGIKLGLTATRRLLEALGNPERQLCNVIVAGTNGKGGTSHMLATALNAAGVKVGLFTSPHLLRFTERIRIGGVEIDHLTVVRQFERILEAERSCGCRGTFFECATVMAILAFAEADVDVAVLEVGLGGRLDATNAVDKTLAVVTPIDFDHERLLGDSLEAIASEKAAVIPEDGRVVIGPQHRVAHAVLHKTAHARRARVLSPPDLHACGDHWRLAGGGLDKAVHLDRLPPAPFQRANLTVATAAAATLLADRCLSHQLEPSLAQVVRAPWLGRYQWLSRIPPVLLDGAHNPAGIAAFLKAMADDPRTHDRPAHCVFTALRTKRFESMVAPIAQRVASLHLCPTSSKRTYTADELARMAPPDATTHTNAALALEGAEERARRDGGFVLVLGSLFLVADAIAHFTDAERDPPVDG